MEFDVAKIIRTAKRLQEATGYLELGMTQHSLACLDSLSDAGPLKAEVAALRDRAQRLQQRCAGMAVSVQDSPVQETAPKSKETWLTLSVCYQLAGDVDHAVHALAQARGAKLPPAEEDESDWSQGRHRPNA
jgi:Flp pilus assembly protein TadD